MFVFFVQCLYFSCHFLLYTCSCESRLLKSAFLFVVVSEGCFTNLFLCWHLISAMSEWSTTFIVLWGIPNVDCVTVNFTVVSSRSASFQHDEWNGPLPAGNLGWEPNPLLSLVFIILRATLLILNSNKGWFVFVCIIYLCKQIKIPLQPMPCCFSFSRLRLQLPDGSLIYGSCTGQLK